MSLNSPSNYVYFFYHVAKTLPIPNFIRPKIFNLINNPLISVNWSQTIIFNNAPYIDSRQSTIIFNNGPYIFKKAVRVGLTPSVTPVGLTNSGDYSEQLVFVNLLWLVLFIQFFDSILSFRTEILGPFFSLGSNCWSGGLDIVKL